MSALLAFLLINTVSVEMFEILKLNLDFHPRVALEKTCSISIINTNNKIVQLALEQHGLNCTDLLTCRYFKINIQSALGIPSVDSTNCRLKIIFFFLQSESSLL